MDDADPRTDRPASPAPDDDTAPERPAKPAPAKQSASSEDASSDGKDTTAEDGEGGEPVEDITAEGDGDGAEGTHAGAQGAFAVRTRVTWRGMWQLVAFVILFLAAGAFIAGGVMRGKGAGSLVFVVLGGSGVLLFGAGMLMSAGAMLARRPVLEIDSEGVRRPARWPLPRRADRGLPWSRTAALTAVRRGVAGTRGGVQDYLVFLPTPELAELARTAERPHLVALTIQDVPATREAVPWCFPVEPGWDATLPEIVRQARRRHRVTVIDRRTK